MSLAPGPINPLMVGYRRFIETLFPDPSQRHERAWWSQSQTRRLRHRYLWAFYDQSVYTGIFSEALKREMGLYKNVRPAFDAITRLVEFHVTHLMGGLLDREAGDGNATPSALPIIRGKKAHVSVNECVARTWKCSTWQRKKSLYNRYGAAMGDVALELVDDPKRGEVRIRVINPMEVTSAAVDAYGSVRSATLERDEPDPADREGSRMATYKEEVELRDDGTVHYKTYKDGAAYQWPGTKGPEWDSPFPFVPIVLVQHLDQGFPWGVAEPAGAIYKTCERDNQGSNLGDAVVKMNNGPWFLKGAELGPSSRPRSPWEGDPFGPQTVPQSSFEVRTIQLSAKSDMPFITCFSKDASITPLIYPVPVDAALNFINALGDALERDYPELQADLATASGEASGRALRVARQKATAKIQERRSAYDEGLAMAQMMALVMGGLLGYDGYGAFGPESHRDGRAEHWIGERSVFPADPLDLLEIEKAQTEALKGYVDVGFPLRAAMEQLEFAPEEIESVEAMRKQESEEDRKAEEARLEKMLAASSPEGPGDGTNPPPLAAGAQTAKSPPPGPPGEGATPKAGGAPAA